MQTTKTIPEQVRSQTVVEFRVVPNSKDVTVVVQDGNKTSKIVVDITTDWTAATTTQKNTIRAFFKTIGALALDQLLENEGVDVVSGDITGDLFDGV